MRFQGFPFDRRANRRAWSAFAVSAAWCLCALTIAANRHGPADADAHSPSAEPVRLETALTAPPARPAVLRAAPFVEPAAPYPERLPARTTTKAMRLNPGGALVDAVMAAGVDRVTAHKAAYALRGVFDARKLAARQEITVHFRHASASPAARVLQTLRDDDGRFTGFSFRPAPERTVRVTRAENGEFTAAIEDAPLQETPRLVSGVIRSSLYEAAVEAGLPLDILTEFIRIYSFDVDFQRELRSGDRFEVFFTEMRLPDGRAARSGDVLAASLDVKKDPLAYYRFTMPDGRTDYFDENGKGARKFLMKTPVDGARLSSTFGKRRHPVLGYVKNHWGVDFAAPPGTPIMAAGDGVIERASRWSTYGNYIRIRHANGWKTAYAHLNGYARGIRSGVRVRQGQIIGYVGATGRVTGPHLHYEVFKDGSRVNPMRIRVPTGVTLAGADLENFRDARDRLAARREALLADGPPTVLASQPSP